jgi:hypothetical protein
VARPDHVRRVALLLLPRALETFILREQAEDLLQARNVLAVDPPRVPYGAALRLPEPIAEGLAARQGRRIVKALDARALRPRVVVIFHPVQAPVALAVVEAAGQDCELWYGRWDRYEHAYDASPARQVRLELLHGRAAQASALTFVASAELARLEEAEGRAATLVPLAADTFPAPDPSAATIAVSLGHLGRRTDWALLRAVGEAMPELTLLLVGEWHDDEVPGDADYAWCRAHPGFVWLGRRSDEEAARLVLCADVGIVPFRVEPFNDAGLPYRILKYARLGRRTVTPDLRGVRTWDRAVDVAPDADAFVAALRAARGRRTAPDLELREWALAQTAASQNAPLWDRLRELGIA